MQIVYHLGAHCTDEGQLLRCLRRNQALLREEAIEIADPARYRPLFGETLRALRGSAADGETQAMMLDAILEQEAPERIVFSHDAYLGIPARILENGRFYPVAPPKTRQLRQLFPDHEAEFLIALRNPATFLPAAFARQKDIAIEDWLARTDPMEIRWSELIEGIRAHNPDVAITVWCNEDTPLIWPEVLRAVSGHSAWTELDGVDDYLAALMSEEGMRRLRAYLAGKPPETESQRRRIVAAFLEKFAKPDALEMEIDVPGWTDEHVEAMTALYEEDLHAIEAIAGVRLILP